MQVTRLHIENFRGIRELDVDFLAEGGSHPRPLTLFLGQNGSGKTTALQAIALTLSLATRQTAEPALFKWPGFIAERVSSLGTTRVEVGIEFDAVERDKTRELFNFWTQRVRPEKAATITPPGNFTRIVLVYDNGILSSLQGPEALSQCLGRYFIKTLLQSNPQLRADFASVGDVFWFDQHRNLMTLGDASAQGIERLREYLIGWWGFHTSPRRTDAKDFLGQLEQRFAKLFPGTKFVGVEPRAVGRAPSAADAYVLLERDGKVYDLAEMSSGEQSVFPLLYEFVRLDIARSVVLIDELELHLHPPQQQALIAALRSIGPDCQFILTTHSPYLESVTPTEHEVRLAGGQQCL